MSFSPVCVDCMVSVSCFSSTSIFWSCEAERKMNEVLGFSRVRRLYRSVSCCWVADPILSILLKATMRRLSVQWGRTLPAIFSMSCVDPVAVSYTHLRAHETGRNLVCRLLLEKKKKTKATETMCTTQYNKDKTKTRKI